MRVDDRAEEYAMIKTRGGFARGDLKGLSNGVHLMHAFVAEREQETYVGSVQVSSFFCTVCSVRIAHDKKVHACPKER